MSREDAIADLTSPGAAFELESVVVRDIPMRVYRHAPASLRDVLASTTNHGDRTFLVYRDERITFDEHLRRVAGLAGHLAAHGVTKGDRVALGMRNYPEWAVGFWAAISLGAIAVPLNAWWLGSELAYAIHDAGAKALLIDDERFQSLRAHRAELDVPITIVSRLRDSAVAAADGVTMWEELPLASAGAALPTVAIEPDDYATIMYTSGTTGRPKGALATHRNHCTNIMNTGFVGALALAMSDARPEPGAVPRQPAVLQVFPFFHIGGLTGLYTATAFGSKLVTMFKWDLDEAIDHLVAEEITSTGMVPMLLRQLLESPRLSELPPDTLAAISSGGAPVPPDLIRSIERRFEARVSPANGYGLTETTSAVVLNTGPDYFEHPDSIGRPVLGADIRIVDEQGCDVPDGTVGELWVSGPNIVDGYWNRPAETAAVFTDGWFHTGDLGYRDDDGFYHVVDRAKDVVIRGGENIYCAEVEAVLFEHPAIEDVAIIGLPDDVYGEEAVAVINVHDGTAPSASEIQEFAATRLARFKVPTRVIFRAEALPRTATGKILKRDLRTSVAGRG